MTGMTEKIISRREDAAGHIVFNNPDKRNAVSLEMWLAAERALDAFGDDDRVRVVVLSGAGDKAFVSGADISKFESERAGAEAVAHYNATTAGFYQKLTAFPKPTIAEITGSCVGGGVALALCCDLRICGQSSRFGIPAARLGLGYGFAGLKRLVDVVGPAFAKEMFFTARLFSAAEAYEMRLVNRVLPDAEVAGYVADYARTISRNAPLTVDSVKAIVGEVLKDPAERDLARCAALVDACFASRDYVEGRRAFLEKRAPAFTGT
jgi:enoyl-CoA hydratase/carnithine racemase